MQLRLRSFAHSILILALAVSAAHADEVGSLITFTAGTPARASEVNDNFAAVKTAVNGTHADVVALQEAVATLEETVAALTTQLTALQSENATLAAQYSALASQLDGISASQIMALDSYLTVTGGTRPTVRFSGINVQIVNGAGSTATSNGLGNLIVGYDEPSNSGTAMCSIGSLEDPELGSSANAERCTSGGGVWSPNHKSGSHYVVVGSENSYSQYGGIVAGWRNASTGELASVTAGLVNKAFGKYSAVTGGSGNVTSGLASSVSGGSNNIASSYATSVSGGLGNMASASNASVSGGFDNEASGDYASVSGGQFNEASAVSTSISGGEHNSASGLVATVSGGRSRSAVGLDDWVAGSLMEDE